jgi:hypothetical protein
LLKNPKPGFVVGKINWYADSTGSDAYNLAFEAALICESTKSQGVTLGERFETNGYGKAIR